MEAVPAGQSETLEVSYETTLAETLAAHRLFASAAPRAVRRRSRLARLRNLAVVYGLIAGVAAVAYLVDRSGLLAGRTISGDAVLGAYGGIVATIATFVGFSPAILNRQAKNTYERAIPELKNGPLNVIVRFDPSSIEVRRPMQDIVRRKAADAMIADVGGFYVVYSDIPIVAVPKRAIDATQMPAFASIAAHWGLTKRRTPPRLRALYAAMILAGPVFLLFTLFRDAPAPPDGWTPFKVTLAPRGMALGRNVAAGPATLTLTPERGGLNQHWRREIRLSDSAGSFDVFDSPRGYVRGSPAHELEALALRDDTTSGVAATSLPNGDTLITWQRDRGQGIPDRCARVAAFRRPDDRQGYKRAIYTRLCSPTLTAPDLAALTASLTDPADAAFEDAHGR